MDDASSRQLRVQRGPLGGTDPRARAFRSGVLRTLPFLSGMVPFGVLYATLAVAAGWSWALTLFMSVAVFGGSSQLVFIDLLGRAAPPLQAALGANIVNARHLIYSAGLSETFAPFPRRWKIVLSYLMTDQLFAVSRADRKQMEALPPAVRPWFFFGSGLFTWAGWLASTALGLVFGEAIPASWNLSFAIPLMFMPMVFVTGH